MSKRQNVKGALEEEEGGQRDSTRRSGARRALLGCSRAEETDAVSVPRKTFLNL